MPVLRDTIVIRKPQTGRSHFESEGRRAGPLIRFQLYLLKLKKRNLKVLLSIGGWTYSQKGHFAFVTTPSKRTAFINSIITFIEDYGFDGMYVSILFRLLSTSALTRKLVTSILSTLLTMRKQLDMQTSLPRPGPRSTNWLLVKAIACLISSPYAFLPSISPITMLMTTRR